MKAHLRVRAKRISDARIAELRDHAAEVSVEQKQAGCGPCAEDHYDLAAALQELLDHRNQKKSPRDG